MRYERALVDADDTLFDFQAGNRRAIGQLMEELGLASDTVYDEYQQINHACWHELEQGRMTQQVLHVERFRRFLASKGRRDDPEAVAVRFAQLLGQQAIPLPFAEEFVRRLSERMPVVILTNGITEIQHSRMGRSPIRQWIHSLVISQEVGLAKPDPRIFQLALEGVAPARAIMIGDGIQSDVRGANAAHVDMCWFNPKGAALPDDLHVEYEVRTLEEALKIATQA